jgi:outer membrane receptor protein involved in Fe transport
MTQRCGAAVLTFHVAVASAQAQQPGNIPPMEEIVVTGSYMERRDDNGAVSPLTVVTREKTAALGVTEFADLVERLTINIGSQNNPDAFTQNLSTGTTNVNLRGLGVGATLVLVNGLRQTPSAITTDRGESFVDTSSLPPLIALERVEILHDGASALYGSDAVAGVVNLITRDDFHGLDLQVDMQSAHPRSHTDRQLSALFGAGDENKYFLAAFNTLERSALNAAQRRLSGPQDDLSQAGNPGSYLVVSRTDGSANGTPPIFADPDCAEIAASDPTVVPYPGGSNPAPDIGLSPSLCQFDFGDFYALVAAETRHAGYVGLTADLGRELEADLEFHAASNESRRSNSPSFPFSSYPQVDASHPDNPFGTAARFIGRIQGSGSVAAESLHRSDTRRVAARLSGDLSDSWEWQASLQASTNEFLVAADDVLADRFDLAISGFGGAACSPLNLTPGSGNCFYYNPFGSALTGTGTRNSPELLASLKAPFQLSARSSLTTFAAVLTGRLPGIGQIAIGAESRRERLDYRYDPNSLRDNFTFFTGAENFSGSRNVTAAIIELAVPVADTLTLQLAARSEDYGGSLQSSDPKISLLWRPAQALALRASYGTAFRAPSLFQAAGTQTTLEELVDPAVGVPQFFPVRTQPDPDDEDLRPEQADTFQLSIDWTPLAALQLKFAYWLIDYSNVIIRQNPQALLTTFLPNAPSSNPQIERDMASGSLLRVNSYYANASKLTAAGYDLSLSYSIDTGRSGSLRAGAGTTLTSTYDLVDPQLGLIEGAGLRNFTNFATSAPTVRGNLFLNWRLAAHGINAYLSYISAYLNDESELGSANEMAARIGSHLSVDLQYSLRMTDRFEIAIGAINLFDARPPYVATNGGYDSKVHDPRGRLAYLRARLAL